MLCGTALTKDFFKLVKNIALKRLSISEWGSSKLPLKHRIKTLISDGESLWKRKVPSRGWSVAMAIRHPRSARKEIWYF